MSYLGFVKTDGTNGEDKLLIFLASNNIAAQCIFRAMEEIRNQVKRTKGLKGQHTALLNLKNSRNGIRNVASFT